MNSEEGNDSFSSNKEGDSLKRLFILGSKTKDNRWKMSVSAPASPVFPTVPTPLPSPPASPASQPSPTLPVSPSLLSDPVHEMEGDVARDHPLNLKPTMAPKKDYRRRANPCYDEPNLISLKRRPEDFYGLPENAIYKIPEDFVPLGEEGVFIAIRPFKNDMYVCVRKHSFNQISLKWVPSPIFGLNLTLQEWELMSSERMIGLVRDAISQLEEYRGPIPKDNLEHELAYPTSFPTHIKDNIMQHRHEFSHGKFIVIDRHYSPTNAIQVSLLKFELNQNACDPLQPQKGIHLSLDTWFTLVDQVGTVNEKINAELEKYKNKQH